MNSSGSEVLVFEAEPARHIEGEVRVAGDKSISHRAVMLASIATGESEISGFLQGEDCLATLNAFKQMGVKVQGPDAGRLQIKGVGLNGLSAPKKVLDLGNSGTSMRLMSGLLAGQNFASTLCGDESLMKRPMRRVADPLSVMGALVSTESDGKPPIHIQPSEQIKGIRYELPVASAQVKSAILLAGLYAQSETTIVEPKVTRDHTERMLQTFGVELVRKNESVTIYPPEQLRACRLSVPSDISSAAFFMVAAAIAQSGSIALRNVGINPTRTGVIDILRLMGANIEVHEKPAFGHEPVADIEVCASELSGIDVPVDLVPSAIDEFPILCIAAACAKGVTSISDAAELRVKESDRIAQMESGLSALGIQVSSREDGMSIQGGEFTQGVIDSGGDHRIAMAFAVASLRASSKIKILDCDNVATSFPNFVELAQQVGLSIEQFREPAN